jgi:hypothetical protein
MTSISITGRIGEFSNVYSGSTDGNAGLFFMPLSRRRAGMWFAIRQTGILNPDENHSPNRKYQFYRGVSHAKVAG